MNPYERFARFRPRLNEMIDRSRALHEAYTREKRAAFERWLGGFAREELLLAWACAGIGLTARGERIETGSAEQRTTRYPIAIRESAEEVLSRYAGFFIFRTREELIDRMGGYTVLARETEDGLAVLEGLPSRHPEKWPPLAREPVFTDKPVQIVAMDYTDDVYDHFEMREDVARQIGALQQRFYEWMSAQEGIQPFRVHQTHEYEGEIVFEDWAHLIGHDDFVDWINVRFCGERAARSLVGQTSREPATRVSF